MARESAPFAAPSTRGTARIRHRSAEGRPRSLTASWLALAASAGVLAGWILGGVVADRPTYAQTIAPDWLPVLAAASSAAAIVALDWTRGSVGVGRALQWAALLLMVWTANGLPFDVLAMGGLIGQQTASGAIVPAAVSWPGLITRAFALAAVVLLARRALAHPPSTHPPASPSSPPVRWYGFAAFTLALPYPVLRLHWALGGMLGLTTPGAGGEGFAPLLLGIPWVLAAAVSLLLAWPPRWMPRRLLLLAGWSATAIVATIGPGAAWSFVRAVLNGTDTGSDGIELWVYGLFYGSWFLWAIAAAAATRSYQLHAPS